MIDLTRQKGDATNQHVRLKLDHLDKILVDDPSRRDKITLSSSGIIKIFLEHQQYINRPNGPFGHKQTKKVKMRVFEIPDSSHQQCVDVEKSSVTLEEIQDREQVMTEPPTDLIIF